MTNTTISSTEVKYSPNIEAFLDSDYISLTPQLALALIEQIGGEAVFLKVAEPLMMIDLNPRSVLGFKESADIVSFFNANKQDVLAYAESYGEGNGEGEAVDGAAGVIHWRFDEGLYSIDEIKSALDNMHIQESRLSKLQERIAITWSLYVLLELCDTFMCFSYDMS